jgi:F0F1-type ATP synthase assembly protein I
MSQEEKPKLGKVIEGAEQLSLGISMVVAVLLGIGLGLWLKSLFGHVWLLWMGVLMGIVAAGLNIYRAYKSQMAELDTLKDDPRYKHYNNIEDEDDEKY